MSGQRGRRVDDGFVDVIADYRELGYVDDAIAARLGITVEGLYRRFSKLGIERGRRWRDIEDAQADVVLTRSEARQAGYRRAS